MTISRIHPGIARWREILSQVVDCKDFMEVLAVSSEPLSRCISLLTGNLTGKSGNLGRSFAHSHDGMLHNSRCLAARGGPSVPKKNWEFFKDIRELKFPDRVSSSEASL